MAERIFFEPIRRETTPAVGEAVREARSRSPRPRITEKRNPAEIMEYRAPRHVIEKIRTRYQPPAMLPYRGSLRQAASTSLFMSSAAPFSPLLLAFMPHFMSQEQLRPQPVQKQSTTTASTMVISFFRWPIIAAYNLKTTASTVATSVIINLSIVTAAMKEMAYISQAVVKRNIATIAKYGQQVTKLLELAYKKCIEMWENMRAELPA